MIKAEFTKEAGDFIRLDIVGHAGQAKIGKDVVCSAASILAYTLAQTIKYTHTQGWLKSKPVVNLKSGRGTICCYPKDEYYNECLMAFFQAEVGYSLLAHNYPQYVDIKMFGKPSEA